MDVLDGLGSKELLSGLLTYPGRYVFDDVEVALVGEGVGHFSFDQGFHTGDRGPGTGDGTRRLGTGDGRKTGGFGNLPSSVGCHLLPVFRHLSSVTCSALALACRNVEAEVKIEVKVEVKVEEEEVEVKEEVVWSFSALTFTLTCRKAEVKVEEEDVEKFNTVWPRAAPGRVSASPLLR
jgi:hypothetical protein